MITDSLTGWNRTSLRIWLLIFFLALALPTIVLINQTWSQLQWESFHSHRLLAEELAGRIDRRFAELITAEESRAYTDYAFLNVAGDPAANFLQRSPLADFPVNTAIPGLIGYFQVDNQGRFSSPLLPEDPEQSLAYGVSRPELAQRQELQALLQRILYQNRLAEGRGPAAAPAEPAGIIKESTDVSAEFKTVAAADEVNMVPAPPDHEILAQEQTIPAAALDKFDDLQAQAGNRSTIGKGRVEDLQLEKPFERDQDAPQARVLMREIAEPPARQKRLEQSALPEQIPSADRPDTATESDNNEMRISIFESEIDAFEVSLLDSGHLVLYRKVWRDGQRYIQGALIETERLISGVIEEAFRTTAISSMSDLTVAWQGNVFSVLSGQPDRQYTAAPADLTGSLLYQMHLTAPLNDLELIFSVTRLPAGAGGTVVMWTAALLLLIMSGGFVLMYRLGLGQINLARQQQDFVSAVSHELKTPLTSIRMYGEMLREGWAEEARKKTYYDYIYDESERLSRLISNVLQLARMTRNDLQMDMKRKTVGELLDGVRSKVATQIERAGFDLNLDCDADCRNALITVDSDCFSQIIINLVDNALKFSRKSERRVIDIQCRGQRDGGIVIAVRDYGPGIAASHIKKIFRLFYRPENELTRETVGTGIGLALVKQLVQAMHGTIDVVNCDPGAEFRVGFPAAET